jgi:hypothetical protein
MSYPCTLFIAIGVISRFREKKKQEHDEKPTHSKSIALVVSCCGHNFFVNKKI